MTEEKLVETEMAEEDGKRLQYLRVLLGGETFGLHIMEVQEILEPLGITHVPRMPESLLGVCNVRGEIIAVVDLKKLLGLNKSRKTLSNRVVVIETGRFVVAVLVDSVQDFISIPESQIEPAGDENYVVGVYRNANEDRISLLNLEKLLDPDNVFKRNGRERIGKQ